MAHFVPIAHTLAAEEIAQLLVAHVIHLQGFQERVPADCGLQFLLWFWHETLIAQDLRLNIHCLSPTN